MYSFRIPSSSLWVLFWYRGRYGRNRKSTWVSIQIIQFGSQGLLDTESQLWSFPPPSRLLLPAAVALGFPEYKLLLSFSLTCSPSWENIGQTLALSSLCRICKWKWSSYFSHSQDGCEDPLKKLVRKSSEMITRVSDTDITLLTHPLKTHLGQLPWVTRWGGPGVVSMGCRFWFWEDPEQPVLTQTGILTSHLSSFLVKISISSSYCPQVILATLSIVKLACKIQT